MPYVLGVDVGRTRGAAAVCRHDGPPEVVTADLPSVLAVENAQMVVGAPALAVSASRVAADLVDQVGDDVPVLLDGVAYTAHDLLAALVAAIADQVVDAEGGPPDRIAVTHPPGWGTYRRGLLRDALAAAGFPGALLLPTVVAAGEAEHFRAPLQPGQSLAVALLGGRHVEFASLIRGQTAFEVADHTSLPDPDAGCALDDLLSDLGGQAVKERLSTAAEVRVGEAVVTRAAFADLARPLLTRTTDAFHAYLTTHRPTRAALAGGTARIPLLASLLDTLPAPTTIPEDPATAPARGAALAARPRLPAPRAGGHRPGADPLRPPSFDGSDPRMRAVGSGSPDGSDPRMRAVGSGSPDGSDPRMRAVGSGSPDGSDPRMRAVGSGSPDGSDPRMRAVGPMGSDPRMRPVSPDSSDPRMRAVGPMGSDPRMRPVSPDSSDPRMRAVGPAGSHPRMLPVDAPGGRGATGSDPAMRPVGGGGSEPGTWQPGSDLARRPATTRAALDTLDTVVSHPGFPPVRLPMDTEPPPRPPVEITPLEPPPRRFPRARRSRGDA